MEWYSVFHFQGEKICLASSKREDWYHFVSLVGPCAIDRHAHRSGLFHCGQQFLRNWLTVHVTNDSIS